jgi:hypothetical protein
MLDPAVMLLTSRRSPDPASPGVVWDLILQMRDDGRTILPSVNCTDSA